MSAAVALAALCVCAGAAAACRLRSRASCLRAWQRALFAMRAACAYSRSSCAQILRAGAAEAPELRPIARQVELTGVDAEALFAAQRRDRRLKNEEYRLLLSVLRAVSRGSREEIGETIAFALERFGTFCADCDRKRQADERMYVMLGVLSGVCVFLLLC